MGARPAQHLDLGGVADRVDHVVAVGSQAVEQPLGQGPGPFGLPQLVADGDHPLAGLLEATPRQLVAQHVGERQRLEAARPEERDHLALPRRVRPRDAQDHGLRSNPPAPTGQALW